MPNGYVGDCEEMKNCGPMMLPTAYKKSVQERQKAREMEDLPYMTAHVMPIKLFLVATPVLELLRLKVNTQGTL